MDAPPLEAMYYPEGDGFVATVGTQGAWDPAHQHGGAFQSLITRCIEARVSTLVPMQLTRLTFDMIRPVPIGPRLDITTRILREGKRIQLVEAVLTTGDVERVRATALRLRTDDLRDLALPASTLPPGAGTIPGPDDAAPMIRDDDDPRLPGFLRVIDMRRFQRPGAPEGVTGYWVRALAPLVAGEELTPMCRLSLTGDFTNMIGVLLEVSSFTTINPDLSMRLLRPPVGEWIAVVGDTFIRLGAGLGNSVSELRDLDGVIASASTSQLVQRR